MIDKQKIRIMTNLAIYDKNMGVKDKEKNEMLQFDYVYKSNFWARISAFFGCLIILMFYVVKLVLVEQIDLFNFDYKSEVTNIIYYVVAVLVFYTIVNGAISNVEYMKAQMRLQRYYKMLDALNGKQEPQHSSQKEAAKTINKFDNDDDDIFEEYERRLRSRTDLDSLRTGSLGEYDDDDDEIPANRYPDVRSSTRTTASPIAQRTRTPRSAAYRNMAQSKNAALRGSRITQNLSANKGAAKEKNGKYTSD